MRLPETIPFLGWAWDDLLFLILAGILLGAALFVAIGRNIIRSGLSMILSFAALTIRSAAANGQSVEITTVTRRTASTSAATPAAHAW